MIKKIKPFSFIFCYVGRAAKTNVYMLNHTDYTNSYYFKYFNHVDSFPYVWFVLILHTQISTKLVLVLKILQPNYSLPTILINKFFLVLFVCDSKKNLLTMWNALNFLFFVFCFLFFCFFVFAQWSTTNLVSSPTYISILNI